ncbi:MAG: hypothetical protein LBU13_11525 [Synergistaceae bacterium]|nr:hypothetical protein [Synergistaceae bacterium]
MISNAAEAFSSGTRTPPRGRDADKNLSRPAHGGETTPEDAARIDSERAVQLPHPFRGDVAVNHCGTAAVVLRPVDAFGKAEFIPLASRIAVETERPDVSRGPSLVFFRHSGGRRAEDAREDMRINAPTL